MRIAVLAYNLNGSGGLSVGKNITSLLPRLGRQHHYLMLLPEGLGYDQHAGLANVQVKNLPRMGFADRIKFDLFTLPKLVGDFKADLVLGLGNIGINNCSCPQALLFHQSQVVYPLRYSGNLTLKERFRLWAVKRRIRSCLGSTDRVFCQTPVVQGRFANEMRYPRSKIKLLPNAVSEFAKFPGQPPKPTALSFNENWFTLFYLAGYMPHKNFQMIVEAFRVCREQLKDVRCIITISDKHEKARKLLDNVKKLHLENQIINVGQLDQSELAGYYCHSDALLFPTLLESFSGTYLEAMHFGLPIITSNLDFAHYICDDAALYFDPWDPRDIAEKIITLKNSTELQKSLTKKGQDRITGFFRSWNEIVADLLKEIEVIQKNQT